MCYDSGDQLIPEVHMSASDVMLEHRYGFIPLIIPAAAAVTGLAVKGSKTRKGTKRRRKISKWRAYMRQAEAAQRARKPLKASKAKAKADEVAATMTSSELADAREGFEGSWYGYASYDNVGDHVANEMFGQLLREDLFGAEAELEAEEEALDSPGGTFKLNPPPWVLPAAGGLAAGVGLTALGFTFFGKKRRKRAAESMGVDPRLVDSRRTDERAMGPVFGAARYGALNSESLTSEEEYGYASYDNVGTSVANAMFGGIR